MKYILFITLTFVKLNSSGQHPCNFRIDSFLTMTMKDIQTLAITLKTQSFKTFKNTRDIPSKIKSQLACLTEDGFSIANPNEKYRCCCMSPKELPKRKLLLFLQSKDFFIITYLTGGVGVSTTIEIYKLQNDTFLDSWIGNSFNEYKSKDELIKELSSLKKPERMDWARRIINQ